MGTIVQLKSVRIAFIDQLFVPGQYEGKGPFRHSCTLIVAPESTNDKLVLGAIKGEAANLWAKKAETMLEDLRGNKQKYCYIKNKKDSKGEIYDGFEGMFALSAIRKVDDGAPMFLHSQADPSRGGKPKLLTGSEGVIYAGCYVNAKVEIWAQGGTHSGIRCGLLGVQYAGPGDAFGGASRPTDEGFDAIEAGDDLA